MRCESTVLLLVGFFYLVILPVRSQFRFTLMPPPASAAADARVGSSSISEDADGNPVETPRGLFHYSDTEQNLQSRFKIPDFQEMDPLRLAQDLMSAAAKAQTRRKSLGGFNIPLPIGATPMNLQIASDTRKGVSLSDDGKENKTRPSSPEGPAKEAFEKAKSACLHSNTESCDEALDTYYRVKYGTSLIGGSTDDPSTDLATMMVPGLGRRLEKMTNEEDVKEEEEENPTSSPVSLVPPPSRRRFPPSSRRYSSLPPRLPPRSSTPMVSKIRGFLNRIH